MRAVERLDEETVHLRADVDAECDALLEASRPADYQRYLTRSFGFIAPLERCLADTPGLAPYVDAKRLRKHLLIEHDLRTLGLRTLEVQSIPQCMWIPWFDNPCTALGWAFVIERNTLGFPNLFRYLASVLPGEAAFATSYLKVYAGLTGEMWSSFCESLDVACATPRDLELIVAGSATAYRSFRRWRNTLDGRSLSSPPVRRDEQPSITDAFPLPSVVGVEEQ